VAPFRSREARGFAAPWTDVEEIADQTQRPKGHLFETMLSLITRSGVPVGSGTRQLVFRSGSRVSVVGFLTTKSPNSTSFSVPRHAGANRGRQCASCCCMCQANMLIIGLVAGEHMLCTTRRVHFAAIRMILLFADMSDIVQVSGR
jgi:hypothetical protein